jgi:ubiquitin-protein ligase
MQNSTQQANNKRREKDVMKLMMSGKFDVQLVNEESTQEFDVLFEGPADSHYEGVSHHAILISFHA